ncbi:copine-9-like [Schistocerca gregaria]|uniref:copine-9-like n=1 Tax=Schistocerca gregaria TaxID=7010 RepID=UPI00211F066E|nr:copine-9-like [Schistocerca gregaria]
MLVGASRICRVSISVECVNLPAIKVGGKNTVQVTCEQISDSSSCQLIGETEQVKSTSDPSFATPFVVEYCFHQLQLLQFTVYHYYKSEKYGLGVVRCTLGELLKLPAGKANKRIEILPKTELKKDPLMVIRASAVTSGTSLTLELSASNLDKKDLGPFAKSDPYLELSREEPDGTKALVYRTEVVHKTLNPTWMPITVPTHLMCRSDYKEPIIITCYDWNKSSSPNLIGEIRTTVEQLFKERYHYFINPKKCKKKNYLHSGTLNVVKIEESQSQLETTFLDYLSGESYFSLMIGIDYTRSNGPPSEPTSLHYCNPCGVLNPYCQAMYNIGNVLLPYTADSIVDIYGFGALLPDGTTSHCLEITKTAGQQGVVGIHAALSAYYQSLTWVTLHGPTNMAPIIRKAADKARTYHSKSAQQTYLVLLILTDGDIDDSSQTTDAIAAASYLPMSILIVGIGDDDFKTIKKLDADSSDFQTTKVLSRDIVTFIAFNTIQSVQQLTSSILRKIPFQFISYMKQNNITPKPRTCSQIVISQPDYQLPPVQPDYRSPSSQPDHMPPPSQPSYQPPPSQPNYQPPPSQPNYQPPPSQPNYQPPPSQPNYQPSPSQPNYQPPPSQPNYQPPPSQLNYQPPPSQPNYQPSSSQKIYDAPPPPLQQPSPQSNYQPAYDALSSQTPHSSAPPSQQHNSQLNLQPAYQSPSLQSTYQPPPSQPAYQSLPVQPPYQPPSSQLAYQPPPYQPTYQPPPYQPPSSQPAYQPSPLQNTYMPHYSSPQFANQRSALQQPVPPQAHSVPVASYQPSPVLSTQQPSSQQQQLHCQTATHPYSSAIPNPQPGQPHYGYSPSTFNTVPPKPVPCPVPQSAYTMPPQPNAQIPLTQPNFQLNHIPQPYPMSNPQSIYVVQPQPDPPTAQAPGSTAPSSSKKSDKSKKKNSRKFYPGQYYNHNK